MLSRTSFTWAGGIEDTFIPHARPGLRPMDQYALTQHYQQWKQDFDLAAEAGVKALRWGIPWYKVQPAPDRWDWAWVDQALEYLSVVKGIRPILDLMHYGTPNWMDNSFINASYPARVAEYAAAVSERYKSIVRNYTPLNEPVVNADFCGRRGEWPPYLTGDDGFVKLILSLTRGVVHTVRALRSVQTDATIVQVEANWHYWTMNPELQSAISQRNVVQFLCVDLTHGKVDATHPLYNYLLANGAQQADLEWFADNKINYDFLGVNFYPWSYGELAMQRNGNMQRISPPTSGKSLLEVLQRVWQRYGIPLMVTETSAKETSYPSLAVREQWMDDTIAAVREGRKQGIPVVGYTWFPLFTMVDWEYRRGRKPVRDYLLHLGIFDSEYEVGTLRRNRTALVDRYLHHQAEGMPEIGTPGPDVS